MDPITILASIVTLTREIHRQVNLAENNKKKLQSLEHIIERVLTALQGLSNLPRHQQFIESLKSLETRLDEISKFIVKCSQASWMQTMANAGRNEKQLEDFRNQILELIPILNIGLTAQQLIDRDQDLEDEKDDRKFFMEQLERILLEVQANRFDPTIVKAIVHEQVASFAETIERQLHPSIPAPLPSHFLVNLAEVVFERYLGEGQLGALYHGTWKYQPVTIKWVEHAKTEEERQLFIREAQIMSRLHNAYIVPFYGACIEKRRMCILMGVMENGDLSTVLSTLSLETRLAMANDLARGLAFLHDEGVIHGDIQLKSVGVTQHNQAKWMEFGLVKTRSMSIASLQTAGYTVSQAVHYQAPESWRRRETLTEASDIYSFGILLWTLMTGQSPYAELSEDEIRTNVSQGQRESIPDTVPSSCATLIEACWSPDVTRRPRACDVVRTLKDITLPPLPSRAVSPTGEEYYLQGVQAEKDLRMEEAWENYLRAAEKQYTKAYNNVALFKLKGTGGQNVNKKEARELLEKGAEKGHISAMRNLARLHEYGRTETGAIDYSKALFWYQQALNQDPENTEIRAKVLALNQYL